LSKNTQKPECLTCGSKKNSVFCVLENLAIKKLSHEKISNTYKRGQALFFQGNPPFGLYCLNSGKVKVFKSGNDGKETIIRIASAGQVIGHRSLFSNSPYTASAMILEDSNICFISKKTIYELFEIEPKLSLSFIEILSKSMGAAEDQVASIAQKKLRERFSELLLILEKSYGKKSAVGTQLDIRLTREEMASMLGTASESLIRLVTEFKKEGLLHQEGKSLYIKNKEKILEYANLTSY